MQNNIAHKQKDSWEYESYTSTPSSHNNFKLSINNFRYTSMSFPGYLGPDIIIDNILYFLFMHNKGDKL